jgi:hypothetical protein
MKGLHRVWSFNVETLIDSRATTHPHAAFTCTTLHSNPTLLHATASRCKRSSPASAVMIALHRRINRGACSCDMIGSSVSMILFDYKPHN